MNLIVDKVMALRKSQIKQWPCRSNRASELGHPCERYLVFLRTRWEEKTLHDVMLQSIFNEGKMHEKAMVIEAQEAGCELIHQQTSFTYPEHNITGTMDWATVVNDPNEVKIVPTEFKGLSPNNMRGVKTVDDIKNNKQYYIKKYMAQLTLYMLMNNKELGLFVFKNKITGIPIEIEVELDYDFAESLLKKADRINKYVEEEITPDCIPYDDSICGKCSFNHICLPEIKRTALEFINDPKMEAMLEKHEKLKPIQAEYKKLHEFLMEKFKDLKKIVIGSWLIIGKPRAGGGWITKINNIEGKEK